MKAYLITTGSIFGLIAIKVLVEHQRGLCVALCLPYTRKLLGGYRFGGVFAMPVSPEVRIWTSGETA